MYIVRSFANERAAIFDFRTERRPLSDRAVRATERAITSRMSVFNESRGIYAKIDE